MYQQVLKLMKKMLSSEHSDTFMSMNNLALMLESQNKYETAEKMHQQMLKLKKKMLKDYQWRQKQLNGN